VEALHADTDTSWATHRQIAEWQIETRQNLDVVVPIP
jgi:hypothetical protein